MYSLQRVAAIGACALTLSAAYCAIAEPATDPAPTEGVTADSANPRAYTRESVKRGKGVYLRYCQDCHDFDGKSMSNVEAESTDLTRRSIWRYGTRDGEVFVTIRDGGGDAMPPFGDQIKDESRIWDMVNFLRSIGPKDERPEYVEEK